MARVPIRELRARYEKGLRVGLDEVVEAFVDESSRIIEAEAVDRGTLLGSVEVRKPEKLKRVVAWTADHAAPVHYGSRPHWAPIGPLISWVRRNLARFENTSGETVDVIRPRGPAAERARRSPDAVVKRIAYAIRAKIAKEGTAPVPWVPRAWSRVKPKAAGILAAAVKRELE